MIPRFEIRFQLRFQRTIRCFTEFYWGIRIIILLEILFDHNTMFYRVLLGIRIIILLEISCDSRDSRQDSKDSGKIRRFLELST